VIASDSENYAVSYTDRVFDYNYTCNVYAFNYSANWAYVYEW